MRLVTSGPVVTSNRFDEDEAKSEHSQQVVNPSSRVLRLRNLHWLKVKSSLHIAIPASWNLLLGVGKALDATPRI